MSLPTANQSSGGLFGNIGILDIIRDLPKFDGNGKMIYEFINNVEEVLQLVSETDGTPYGQIALRAIRRKIEGKANDMLILLATPLNWENIKTDLIQHFADKRTESSLIRDLHTLKQDSSIQQFYDQIIEIQSIFNNNLLLNETDNTAIKTKRNMITELCLNVFLVGLREPLGSCIRAMRPDTISTALSYCIKEQNIYNQQVNSNTSTYDNSPNYKRQFNSYTISYRPNFNRNRFSPYGQINQFQNPNRNNFNR